MHLADKEYLIATRSGMLSLMDHLLSKHGHYTRNRKIPANRVKATAETKFEEYNFVFPPEKEIRIRTLALKKVYEQYKEKIAKEGKSALFGEKKQAEVVDSLSMLK